MAGITANLGLVAARRSDHNAALQHLAAALEQAESLGTHHLVAQICIWLAPLLPPDQERTRLAQARAIAEKSGRRLLLDQVEKLEKDLSV